MIDYKDVEPLLRGMWADIFEQIGIKIPKMRGRNSINCPCPLCGGDDRAHWRDEGGRLSLYCRACAADSMKSPEAVYMQATGLKFNQFIDDMVRFVRYVPIETQTKIKQAYKEKSEPEYSAVMSSHECELFISKQQEAPLTPLTLRYGLGLDGMRITKKNQVVVPVFKMYGSGKSQEKRLVNVALIDGECNSEWLAGKPTQFGYVTIGHRRPGKPIYICADWVDSQIAHIVTGAEVICCFYGANLIHFMRSNGKIKEMAFKGELRGVCNRNFDELDVMERAMVFDVILPVGERIKECNFKFEKAVFDVSAVLDGMQKAVN